MAAIDTPSGRILELGSGPATRRQFVADLAAHDDVLVALARKDFQTRYKRATLGILWAVAVPVLQAAVMAVVFAKIVRFDAEGGYPPFVMTGIVVWSYFASTLTVSSTAIVDNASLTEKVWFPRALLPAVPAIANVVGLLVSTLVVAGLIVFFDVTPGPHIVLVAPAVVLLVGFTIALSEVLAALHVYFRDVRFLVQAVLLVWLYVTPIIYPQDLLGRWSWLLDLNPLTGIVALFRLALLGSSEGWERPVAVAVVATLTLAAVALEAHRRHDRLFADQL